MNLTNGALGPRAAIIVALALAGCDNDKAAANLAPSATALAPAKPAGAEAKPLAIEKASSKVEFMMEAPQEKIRGRSAGTAEGELHVDPADLTKTTGLITVDIGNLEVFQTLMKDGQPGEEAKNDKQNEHARTWLEISPDAPEETRKKNGRVEFSIKSIDSVSQKDVSKMTGADRKVTLKATGDFLLHGRKTQKTAELEATFHYEGDKLASVAVKTSKPFGVGLEEHDVHPREAFGQLAKKTLEVLAPKVAKQAQVSVEFSAKAGGGGEAAKPAEGADKPAADKPAGEGEKPAAP